MAKYTTPQDYADAEWPDADGVTRVAARHGFRDGLMAAREINGYTIFAMVPTKTGGTVGWFAIAAWSEANQEAVSAFVPSLPARYWSHGDYVGHPNMDAEAKRQQALADMLRRAGWIAAES